MTFKCGSSSQGFATAHWDCSLPARRPKRKSSQTHHWEINYSRETKLPALRAILREYFEFTQDYRLRWNPYHHFFQLRKRSPPSETDSRIEK